MYDKLHLAWPSIPDTQPDQAMLSQTKREHTNQTDKQEILRSWPRSHYVTDCSFFLLSTFGFLFRCSSFPFFLSFSLLHTHTLFKIHGVCCSFCRAHFSMRSAYSWREYDELSTTTTLLCAFFRPNKYIVTFLPF